jgi:hypothetical protein
MTSNLPFDTLACRNQRFEESLQNCKYDNIDREEEEEEEEEEEDEHAVFLPSRPR